MRLMLCLLSIVLLVFNSQSQSLNIIPQPVSIKQPRIAAKFSITPATQIVLEGSNLEKTAQFLNDYLQRFYLFQLKVVQNSASNNVIRLNFERLDKPIAGAYILSVNNKGAYIAGDNETGVFYGVQTLIQLLPVPDARLKMRPNKLDLSYVSIEDEPRFEYRGMHLDVGRHFFPADFIKKYIDYLAYHKLNIFHWHLTEDQGWRIEIKKYPKLTTVGGYRNGTIIGKYPGKGNDSITYGGFYTQEEVKEIVKYAADRYITVVPEIEMPGHSSAAIAAYPELSCFPNEPTTHKKPTAWSGDTTGKNVQQSWGVFDDVYCAGKENTFAFLQDVLDEVMPLFPGQYVHVGGDECPKANWKRCPECQKRMKDNNLKDEHQLQSYFIQRMEKYLNSKGKTLIGWDEILEGGLAPNAVVMSWRGEEGGIAAAKEKHKVIMTPQKPVYFDHTQTKQEDSVTIGGYNPLDKVYAYEPVPKEMNAEDAKYVLGAQANVWTEYIHYPSKVEYMVFPRMSALSEVLWSPKQKRDYKDFEKRLQTQFKRYDLWGANYSKAYFDLKASVIPTPDNKGVYWKISGAAAKDSILFHDYANQKSDCLIQQFGKIPAKVTIIGHYPLPYTKRILCSDEYGYTLIKHGIETPLVMQRFSLNKATGKKISLTRPASQKYPGDGAFTLVNGIQNEKGLAASDEFLGFEGTDCEALIDLGALTDIKLITAHVLDQKGGWIWPAASIGVMISNDGKNFLPSATNSQETIKGITCELQKPAKARFVKVNIKNHGAIAEGNPGAGNKAWLFVDEIEVN